VDVRIIAATNRNLRHEVAAGRFREDLYFRLSVFPLETPTLRSRREDIPILAAYFLRQAATRSNLSMPRLTPTNVQALTDYSWPGNIRELQNVVERHSFCPKAELCILNCRKAPRFHHKKTFLSPQPRSNGWNRNVTTSKQRWRNPVAEFTGKAVQPNCSVYVRRLCHFLQKDGHLIRYFRVSKFMPSPEKRCEAADVLLTISAPSGYEIDNICDPDRI
jgi:transcriptional regulator with GAF, ATPase, and Fis domain